MITAQIVADAFDFEQSRGSGDQADRAFQFRNGAERILRSMNKQSRCMQRRKVRGSQLLGLTRRMQRIRKQQEPIDYARRFRRQHAGLPATIRLPAEPDLFGILFAKLQNFLTQAFAILGGIARTWWSLCAILSKSQIVTHYLNPVFRKGILQSH